MHWRIKGPTQLLAERSWGIFYFSFSHSHGPFAVFFFAEIRGLLQHWKCSWASFNCLWVCTWESYHVVFPLISLLPGETVPPLNSSCDISQITSEAFQVFGNFCSFHFWVPNFLFPSTLWTFQVCHSFAFYCKWCFLLAAGVLTFPWWVLCSGASQRCCMK